MCKIVKNKILSVGIAFQIIQLAIIGIVASIYALMKIQWTGWVTVGVMFVLYNIVSIAFIIIGCLDNNQKEVCA